MADFSPTPRLRWVMRKLLDSAACSLNQMSYPVLQQWWAPNVPSYMVDPLQGEWRDVPTEEDK